MAEQILLKGVRLFKKKDSQPEFVIAGGAITMNELFTFAKENPDVVSEYNGKKQIKIQVLRSKDGNPYIAVDTWKPGEQSTGAAKGFDAPVLPDDSGEKLPF